MKRAVLVAVILVLAVPLQSIWVQALADACQTGVFCDVGSDDQKEAIKGSLLIPAKGYSGQDRRRTLACDDCSWSLSPACRDAAPGSIPGCLGATINCPGAAIRLFVWRSEAGGDWVNVGSACFTPGAPRTVGEITPRVRDKFIDLLPKQHPSFQPKAGGLVHVPVIFATGQPGDLDHPTFDLAGFSVTLDVSAKWTWDFDDGKPEKFTKPGGAYPNDDVTHTYLTTDDRSVTVTTTWDGTFTVDDLGPYDITGAAVTQASPPLDVPVRQARGELVAG